MIKDEAGGGCAVGAGPGAAPLDLAEVTEASGGGGSRGRVRAQLFRVSTREVNGKD